MTRTTDQNIQWILNSEELALIQGKKRESQLAFALMLKFFQCENRFPTDGDIRNLSHEIVTNLANYLHTSP